MTLSQKLKLPRYTQLLSLDALNLVVVYIQPPVGPYYQAIDTFPCLYDHPMHSGPEHCAFQLSFLSSSAGDLEESKTTQHSSEIGD